MQKTSKHTTQDTKVLQQALFESHKRYLIGIDAGVLTGVAVWDMTSQKLVSLDTLSHLEFMEWIKQYSDLYDILVVIENPNLNKPVFMTGEEKKIIFGGNSQDRDQALRILLRRAQNIGMNKQIAKTLMEFMESKAIDFMPIRPFRGKVDAEKFKAITKWEGRTNQHNRDAGLLVYGLNIN